MFFGNRKIRKSTYLFYDCEFQEDGSDLLLVSAKNPNFVPFIGKSFKKSAWDLISKADITCGEKHDKVYGYFLNHLEKGNTDFDEMDSNILLDNDEFIKFQSYHSVYLNESKSIRVSTSRHSGRSVRHAGASYGIGDSISVSESFDEIKTVDIGQITITNKRFIFSGEKKSVDIDIKKITSITPFSDAIKLQRKNKQKVEYFTNIDHYIFTREYAGEVYFFMMDGYMIKALIESSLSGLKYISELQLFEAQSIPKLENKTNNSLKSFKYEDINLKYSDSWSKVQNEGNHLFTIKNNNSTILLSIEKFIGTKENFKGKILNEFEKMKFRNFGFTDIKINGIDMFTISTLTYFNDMLFENIYTYFYHNNNWFYVLLTHNFHSDAKNDYFDLIRSITIDSIVPTDKINFCPNCGTKIEHDGNFCMNCGFKL